MASKPIKKQKGNEWIHAFNTESGRVYPIISETNDEVKLNLGIKRVVVTRDRFDKIYKRILVPPLVKINNPDPAYTFDRLVVRPSVVDDIRTGVGRVLRWELINKAWNLQAMGEYPKTVLNFFGPSGTGKTMAALALAGELKRPVFQVDYGQVCSQIVNQSSSNLSLVFQLAQAAGAILFFDEADSLTSTRIDVASSGVNGVIAQESNQVRNVFMQELDAFRGIVILTTNFFGNYDRAILRRVAMNIHFELPNAEMRARIFQEHLPSSERCQLVDWKTVAAESEGLSGGDIRNACLNAIYRVSLGSDEARWVMTTDLLVGESARIQATQAHHSS